MTCTTCLLLMLILLVAAGKILAAKVSTSFPSRLALVCLPATPSPPALLACLPDPTQLLVGLPALIVLTTCALVEVDFCELVCLQQSVYLRYL